MLTLGQQLIGKPALSLRTSAPVGFITDVLVNPNNLKIEGWHIEDAFNKRRHILLGQDVREIISQGFVVNDHESMTAADELVRLKPIIDLHFELINKPVFTTEGKKLGKVTDYAFEGDGHFIQKLYVAQPIVKSISGGSLIVDRTHIIEITQKKIVVAEATVPGKAVPRVNPVQAPAPQTGQAASSTQS